MTFAKEFPCQRFVNQLPHLIQPVDRNERSEARPLVFAQKHGVNHIEELVRNSRPRGRCSLGRVVLIARNRPRDVIERVLDFVRARFCRQLRQPVRNLRENAALDVVGVAIALLGGDKVTKISNRITNQAIETGVRFWRRQGIVAAKEPPKN